MNYKMSPCSSRVLHRLAKLLSANPLQQAPAGVHDSNDQNLRSAVWRQAQTTDAAARRAEVDAAVSNFEALEISIDGRNCER